MFQGGDRRKAVVSGKWSGCKERERERSDLCRDIGRRGLEEETSVAQWWESNIAVTELKGSG